MTELEAARERQRRWDKKNPAKLALYRRRWYERHREEHLANTRAYRARHKRRAAEAIRDGGKAPGGIHGPLPAGRREPVTPDPGVS